MIRTAFWLALAVVVLGPLALATQSPLLAWRDPIYIAAGFAGVIAMALLVLQPLLAGDLMPGLSPRRSRSWHRWVGAGIVLAVITHVAGLWITSPPDVIDVLLFRSPTPFAIWAALAMWAVMAAATLALTRRRWRISVWRNTHLAIGIVIAVATVLHAVQIDGTMETISKWAQAAALLIAHAVIAWRILRR